MSDLASILTELEAHFAYDNGAFCEWIDTGEYRT